MRSGIALPILLPAHRWDKNRREGSDMRLNFAYFSLLDGKYA